MSESGGTGARVEASEGAVVLRPTGSLDIRGADGLRALLRENPAGPVSVVVLDLTDVDFVDSAGLSVLLGYHQECERAGVALRLAVDNPTVTTMLTITGLDQVFEVHRRVDEALPAR